MSKNTLGILMVIFGIFTLIRQFFIDTKRSPRPGEWPDRKKYKNGLIMGGVGFIIFGIIVFLLE